MPDFIINIYEWYMAATTFDQCFAWYLFGMGCWLFILGCSQFSMNNG